MKKIILLLFVVLSFTSKAQDFSGYSNSNYAGVNGIDLQPASIVDNRYKLDILLIGANANAQNNYFTMKSGFLTDINNPSFKYIYLDTDTSSAPKSMFMSTQILGPSFMFTANEKNSFAFTSKVRFLMNVDDVDPKLIQTIYQQYTDPQIWGLALVNKGLNMKAMSWAEYGVSYGREIYRSKHHYFKGGVRLKLLQGIAETHVDIHPTQITVEADSTVSLKGDRFSYGHSAGLENPSSSMFNPFAPGAALGFGGDIGFVYEWRPHSEKYTYEMDGVQNASRDENKYKLRIGASLLDIGAITYKSGTYSKDFNPTIQHWSFNGSASMTPVQVDSILSANFTNTPVPATYSVSLPTVFSLQVDYHIWKTFFVNFTAYQAFRFSSNANQIHETSTYSIAPRWDYKWFGLYVPMSYNMVTGYKLGASAMIGPFFLGTSSLNPLFTNTKGMDVFFGVKVSSLHFKKSDSDDDHVSDKVDICDDVKGLWAFKGCPDTDGDSIPDKDDACPKIPGRKEFKGCPDTDKDGIEDQKDDCPTEPGLKEFYGCPDRDGDKVIDKKDECPDEKGLIKFNGCPDNDGDSIINKLDSCPDLAGPKEHNGCPDTDKDGLYDNQDSCVTEAGPIENQGCPFDDEDRDGVIDKEDECPKTAGPASNKGCPELKKEEEEILNTAFQNLEFETSKAIIKEESFASLDGLAALLIKKSTWKLRVAGHTDNAGDAKKNLKLSKDRTESVAKYLSEKGVDINRIIVEFYGSTKPVADNKTPEGRQKNRRVEMTVVFE
jgi:outer membrane protein OmpA-like peptidoglycan-associated protein